MTITPIATIQRHAKEAAQAGASASRVCQDLGYTPDLNRDAYDAFQLAYRAEQDKLHAARRLDEVAA